MDLCTSALLALILCIAGRWDEITITVLLEAVIRMVLLGEQLRMLIFVALLAGKGGREWDLLETGSMGQWLR